MLLAANSVLGIYLAAALIPAIALMIYTYRKDTVDKEPIGLLAACLGMGVVAAFIAIVLETFGTKILDMSPLQKDSPIYTIVLAFAVVAAVEEGAKMLCTYWKTWKNPNFNYHFDGIVYSVFTSLGFAAFENVKYVFNYGLSVALPRAFLAIPGHMSFAVIMGIFYGRAKYLADHGKKKNGKIVLGWLLATILHGVYDSCAMISSSTSTLIFGGVVLVMYVIIFFIVRKQAREDYKV